jgi:hypothetical protein
VKKKKAIVRTSRVPRKKIPDKEKLHHGEVAKILLRGNRATTTSGQARFYDFVVFSDKKRVEKLRYMHRNPVKRGLVLDPQQWPWSSFCHYAYDEPGPVLVNESQRAELQVRKS